MLYYLLSLPFTLLLCCYFLRAIFHCQPDDGHWFDQFLNANVLSGGSRFHTPFGCFMQFSTEDETNTTGTCPKHDQISTLEILMSCKVTRQFFIKAMCPVILSDKTNYHLMQIVLVLNETLKVHLRTSSLKTLSGLSSLSYTLTPSDRPSDIPHSRLRKSHKDDGLPNTVSLSWPGCEVATTATSALSRSLHPTTSADINNSPRDSLEKRTSGSSLLYNDKRKCLLTNIDWNKEREF